MNLHPLVFYRRCGRKQRESRVCWAPDVLDQTMSERAGPWSITSKKGRGRIRWPAPRGCPSSTPRQIPVFRQQL